jgi:hypothetical protein
MPLATGGISIKIASLSLAVGAHSSLLMNLGQTHSLALPTSQNPLSISPVVQKESQWCWAACVEMVMAALQSPIPQCEVINRFPGPKPPGKPCEDSEVFQKLGCTLDQMTEVWSALHVNAKLIRAPDDEDLPALNFVDLKTEIDEMRPVEVGLSWYEGGGHAMIVKGYGEIDGKESVWINDPLGATTKFGSSVKGGEGEILFQDLVEAYGHGVWACSWTKLTLPEG